VGGSVSVGGGGVGGRNGHTVVMDMDMVLGVGVSE
jgi:hypothetical protein